MVMDMNRNFREGFACREAANAFLQEERNWLFAAISGQTIIGFAYGYALPRLNRPLDTLYVHEVGIMDACQRQGVGYRMMTALKQACAAKGIRKYFLTAYQNNAGANALYRKLGGEFCPESQGNDVVYYFSTEN